MNLALSYALQVLAQLPALIEAGIDVLGLINSTNEALSKMKKENREPTPDEWDMLNAMVEDLRAQRPKLSEV